MEYNKLIDNTNLKPDALDSDIIALCEESKNIILCLFALIQHLLNLLKNV